MTLSPIAREYARRTMERDAMPWGDARQAATWALAEWLDQDPDASAWIESDQGQQEADAIDAIIANGGTL